MASVGEDRRKVLILVENLPSPFDRRVWQEANALKSAHHDVTIICPTGQGYEERDITIDGIRVLRFSLPLEGSDSLGYVREYSVALFQMFRLALKVRADGGIDVIHACNPPDLLFLVGGFFKLFFRTKFVFDHHDLCPELYEAKFQKRGLGWQLMILCERLTFRLADMVISTNESYKQIAIQRGAVPETQVHVVRSGPKLDRLKKTQAVPSLKKGKAYLVGYLGVMGEQEGVDLLLQAAAHIVHDLNRKDVHFGLVGGGTSLKKLIILSEELGLSEFVTFTGRVPDAQLLEMLNTSDVCVNPDIPNDMNDKSTMNKVMEYMSLGKPIVQFDLTEGRRSAMESSLYAQNNDIVDFAEKILYLLDHPEQRKKMGSFGEERIRNELEWKYEEPKLIRAYDSLFLG